MISLRIDFLLRSFADAQDDTHILRSFACAQDDMYVLRSFACAQDDTYVLRSFAGAQDDNFTISFESTCQIDSSSATFLMKPDLKKPYLNMIILLTMGLYSFSFIKCFKTFSFLFFITEP